MYELLLIFDLGSWPVIWDLGVFHAYDPCMEILAEVTKQWPWIQDNFWCVLVENI